MYFTNFTFIPGEATIPKDSPLRTYKDIQGAESFYAKNPWRAPGSAPLASPCGFGGGNPKGCDGGADCPGGGYGFGVDALNQTWDHPVTTTWVRGDAVDVAWGIIANHGGGYSYRLCKIPEEGNIGLTEECFQKGSLDFVGDIQWVQYGESSKNRTAFKAMRTRKGTVPKGSQWTRNPIPACDSKAGAGGFMDPVPGCPEGSMFDPPAPGLTGFGELISDPGAATFGFSIVDQVQVPKHLKRGMYALSFRWDCEQTSQVWNTCSSIRIV